MTDGASILHTDSLRSALQQFWSEALTIQTTENGLAVAMPQTGFDGWQLVLEIKPFTPGYVRVSDGGACLRALHALGQNTEAALVSGHIDSILRQSQVEQNGFELFKILPLPIQGEELHIFTESLVSVTHLNLVHEPQVKTLDIADRTLRRVFADHKVKAHPGAKLSGKTEANIRVDYLVEEARPVAFEIIRTRGRLLPVMEQWGYRWQDLKKVRTNLMPVMLYDPIAQKIDEGSRAIGEEVCSLFCPYNETDRIHEVLNQALN